MQFKRFARGALICTVIGLLTSASGGCAAGYTGMEPFAHTFREDPSALGDYYIGMNLNFAISPETPHVPSASHYEPDIR
jgi:hypothetical protein